MYTTYKHIVQNYIVFIYSVVLLQYVTIVQRKTSCVILALVKHFYNFHCSTYYEKLLLVLWILSSSIEQHAKS